MRAQHPDDSVPNTPHALDEFAIEDATHRPVTLNRDADGMLCFECEAQSAPARSADGTLLDVAGAVVASADRPQPLSRNEAVQERRRTRRWIARTTRDARRASTRTARRLAVRIQRRAAASRARMRSERETMERYAREGTVAIGRVLADTVRRSTATATDLWHRSLPLVRKSGRAWHRSALQTRVGARAAARALARPFSEAAVAHQEFNGFVVAVVLAISVVGYGAFLAVFWRAPSPRPARAAAPVHQSLAVGTPVTASAVSIATVAAVPTFDVARPGVVNATATVEPRTPFRPNTRTLTSLWQRRDTRSLDRAFATLRGETLALRACGMRVTATDRAVARCDGIVIDFQRTAGRWRIARVTPR